MSDEELFPEDQVTSVYDKTLRGFYGEFKSNTSYPLSYVQSVVTIDDIDILKTANEAFVSSNLDFEELVQRDINQERVTEIVDGYLKKGKERVLFFPPLLVSLVAVDDSRLVPAYEEVVHKVNPEKKVIVGTWGKDRFQVVLPFKNEATGYTYKFKDESDEIRNENINPFWATLKINPKKIALVVIDGQHRLSALKSLAKSTDDENKNVVKGISIPICVLYSPDAIEGNNEETISRDLRELFVRINTTAREVSGHFITLLNDKSLSSFVVREFCGICKNSEIDGGLSLLNLIEWNQRESKIASKVNRKYSITTIHVIYETLKDFAFSDESSSKDGGLTKALLNLESIKNDLEIDDAINIDMITESTFSASQIKKLREVCKEKISKGLKVLFSEPTPYLLLIKLVEKASKELNASIKKGIKGSAYFKNKVLDQYRDSNKFDPDGVSDAEKSFVEISKNEFLPEDKVYQSNVFQQGFIRVWLYCAVKNIRYGVTPEQTAKILVKSLNKLCFDNSAQLFDSERLYTMKILFNGRKFLVRKYSKDGWYNLIAATFLNKSTRKIYVEEIAKTTKDVNIKKLESNLCEFSKECLGDYLETLGNLIHDDYSKHWRDKEFAASVMHDLEELSDNMKDGDEESGEKFEEKIRELSKKRIKDAEDKLKATLRI